MGATLGYDESARAGGAQAARERASHQRDEAQRAALLEQAGEEKRTASQQARLASIREQQASLAAQPIVKWLLTVPADARVKPTEAASAEAITGAEEVTSAEAITGAEGATSANATMDKPARPPDRLNEQFAVTSAVFVQEPGDPARRAGRAEKARRAGKAKEAR